MCDVLHPNAFGHRLIAEEFLKYLRANMAKPVRQCQTKGIALQPSPVERVTAGSAKTP